MFIEGLVPQRVLNEEFTMNEKYFVGELINDSCHIFCNDSQTQAIHEDISFSLLKKYKHVTFLKRFAFQKQ